MYPDYYGSGAWYRFDQEFVYKLMKYQQSCFPCSVHTILANLGYVAPVDSSVEDLWNSYFNVLGESILVQPHNTFYMHWSVHM